MSVLLILFVLAIAGMMVVGGIVIMMNLKKSSTSPSRGEAPAVAPMAPRSREAMFVMRFREQDRSYIEGLVTPFVSSPVAIRDAALGLTRAAGDATHAFVGPARGGPPTTARCFANDGGGVIVALTSTTTRPLDTVGDDTNATDIAKSLRELSSMRDDQITRGTFAIIAEDRNDAGNAVVLEPLQKQTLPGQQICPYCSVAFPAYETQCSGCGARVKT